MNAAQVLHERGRKEGIEQGILRGQRRLLAQMLVKRFGALPVEISRQLEVAGGDQLSEWGLRLLEAERLEDIFGGGG